MAAIQSPFGDGRATTFAASGLPGATAASRYAGATASGGAPSTGTFAVGDFIVDQQNGIIWVCTVAGSPGTWIGTITIANNAIGNLAVFGGSAFLTNCYWDIATPGKGLQVAEGSNAKQGTFALSGAATTVVSNTSVTANSRIFLTTQALGTVTVASTLAVSAVSAGVSFTVKPSQSTDTSTIAYEIFEPG